MKRKPLILILASLSLAILPTVAKDPEIPKTTTQEKPADKPADKPGDTAAPTVKKEEVVTSVEAAFKKYFIATPLIAGESSLFYIPVAINGEDRVMILDSGADSIVVNKQIADDAKIPLKVIGKAIGPGRDGGKIFGGKIDTFKVAKNYDLGSPDVGFLDLSNLSTLNNADGTTSPNAGQLGLGFLNAIPCAVDYPNKRLMVQKENIQGGITSICEQLGDKVAPMVEDGARRRYVLATIAGKEAYFLVDTGSAYNVVYLPAAETFGLKIIDRTVKVSSIGHDNADTKVAKVDSLILGTLNVGGDLEVVVLPHPEPLPKIGEIPVVGIFGGTLFDPLKATIDFASNKISMAITRKK